MSDTSKTPSGILSEQDVARLLNNPTSEARIATAERVAGALKTESLSDSELPIAQEILWVLAKDAELKVRAALSKELAKAKSILPDMALALALDDDEVAVPMLRFSEVFDDQELVSIIANSGVAKNTAIAGRKNVSESVASALVETGSEEVVATLVSNEGAELTEPLLQKVIDDFPDSDAVKEPLVHRSSLPVSVSERLVALVSEKLRDHLVKHHELSEDVATDLVLQSRERATLGLLGEGDKAESAEELVRELHKNGRLNESIITRAAATGDIAFLEASLAVLAGVPADNARVLIHDAGSLGLKSLYEKSGLPKRTYLFLRTTIDLWHESEYDGEAHDRERFQIKLLERALTGFEDGQSGLNEADEMYMFKRIEALSQIAQS